MSISENPEVRGVIRRAQALIMSPAAEWDRIALEPATVRSLYVPYVLILAAIGPICTLIGYRNLRLSGARPRRRMWACSPLIGNRRWSAMC